MTGPGSFATKFQGLPPALRRRGAFALLLLLLCLPAIAHAQQQASIDTTSDDDPEHEGPKRKLVKWNEYDGPVTTARFGFGFLTDYATYKQDEQSKEQFDME